jgi:hypothetical protein
MEAINTFHAHLDICKQCAENPFDLCKEGLALLKATRPTSKLAAYCPEERHDEEKEEYYHQLGSCHPGHPDNFGDS